MLGLHKAHIIAVLPSLRKVFYDSVVMKSRQKDRAWMLKMLKMLKMLYVTKVGACERRVWMQFRRVLLNPFVLATRNVFRFRIGLGLTDCRE
jgi:hypothetical protein